MIAHAFYNNEGEVVVFGERQINTPSIFLHEKV
jgi:hypothetical protein